MTATVLAFVSARVIDTAAGAVIPDRTVVIRDGIVVAVGADGATPIPAGATVIDARERYLCPGLADMHVHATTPHDLALCVAHGVMTVRNMWGESSMLELRRAVEQGSLL